MASGPARLIGRAAFGVAIGLATTGMARPSILTSGYQFPSLDDGVLRQDGDAAQADKAMTISASRETMRYGAGTPCGQPNRDAIRSTGKTPARAG